MVRSDLLWLLSTLVKIQFNSDNPTYRQGMIDTSTIDLLIITITITIAMCRQNMYLNG